MFSRPFDERVCVVGDRGRRWTLDMLEDSVEHRPSLFCQIGHERTEFAVEVAKKKEGLVAQHRKARVMNGTDRIFGLEKAGHHRWKLLRNRLRVRRRLQGETEGKVALAHGVISFARRCQPEADSGMLCIYSTATFALAPTL